MSISKNKIFDRISLKNFFKNGTIPNEKHFSFLIDSMTNKQDDGINKDAENGLILSTTGKSKKILTVYKKVDDLDPFYFIEVDENGTKSLKLRPNLNLTEEDLVNKSFFFDEDGSLGIGNRKEEGVKLNVAGFIASEGRTGNYRKGTIPADGKWHPIISNLNNCHAFEVIARTGKKTTGRFSILHATALSTFGKSSNKIRKTTAYYGSFLNKLSIRWKSNGTYNYELQLRSYRNYGDQTEIFYRVTDLWDDTLFMPEEYYY
jgi:hypothetical protein